MVGLTADRRRVALYSPAMFRLSGIFLTTVIAGYPHIRVRLDGFYELGVKLTL